MIRTRVMAIGLMAMMAGVGAHGQSAAEPGS